MDEIAVSVLCTVYNHEKYLRKCLDGFVMQKTNFRYEVIVHDDASTDKSADIIREYEQKYPDLIKPIYQKENQYSKGVKIIKTFVFPRVQGKYVAVCEGDDYWCDENKLQKQYDVMETHPNCHLCVHKVALIQEDGTPMDQFYPPVEVQAGSLSTERFLKILGTGYSFQTSGYFRRTEDMREYYNHPPKFVEIADVGDVPSMLYLGVMGEVFYIDEVMSCYRKNSVGSWTSIQISNQEKRLKHLECMVSMYDAFNEWTNYKFKELLMPRREWCHLSCCILSLNQRGNARYLCRRENRNFIKQECIKMQIYVFLKAYAPKWMERFYDRKKRQI